MNAGLKTVTVWLLALLVLAPATAIGQVEQVRLRVDGLSCPFCAYSLEKQIKKVQGARDPVIDVKEGVVTLTPNASEKLDFDALPAAVEKAGFTPREVRIDGRGLISTRDGHTVLVSESDELLFWLDRNEVLEAAPRLEAIRFVGTLVPRAKKSKDTRRPRMTLSEVNPAGAKDKGAS